jgi:2-aminoethylphosphonate-pyruvate transaminase
MILLSPGPVNLGERVRNALLQPDLCHREPEFAELQTAIRTKLLNLYRLDLAQWAAILLTGSGTAAVEAILTTLVPASGKLLIVENGVYGERLSQIASIHHINHQRLSYPWGEAIDVEEIDACLEQAQGVTHLALIHHETTTGRLNRLSGIGELCKQRNIHLLIDGVSSFGAEELDFEAWGIAACAATANKCLHGVPGISFVIVRRETLSGPEVSKRTFYLDLESYCQRQDEGSTPFTQSIQTLYALNEALDELRDQGGWQARQRNYRALANLVREGLLSLGFQPLLRREDSSVVLNAFHLPLGLSYESLHDWLKINGFVIYAGQGGLARSIFRVSTMGAITRQDIERFLAVVGAYYKT